ncbi:MAG TPA: NADPH:quinone reductase [Pseudonocardia sp.]
MRAATYSRTGSARDVLVVRDVDRPEPGPGEVRVRVRLSAVNPTDVKTRDGTTPRPIDGFAVPHQDGVGEIDAVGDQVDGDRLGQQVWLYLATAEPGAGTATPQRWGTAAQWCVVPAEQAVPVPSDVSDELAAALGVPALTAYHCLFGDLRPDGRAVLVAGGAGAVGHFAIELARWAGLPVVATSSPGNADAARAAGAATVIDYHARDAAEQIRAAAPDIGRIVEVALGPNLGLDLAVAGPHATIVAYSAGGEDPVLPVRQCMAANVALRFVLLYGVPVPALRTAVDQVSVALAEGALTALPVKRFPLDEIAAAHEAVESGAGGKVVVDLDAVSDGAR